MKGKDGDYSVYAITLVNDLAGYTLGRMWADPDNPDPRATDRRYGGGFPPGTVFAKLLFTDAPQGQDKLPFLENPLQWKAYITENFSKSSTRKVTTVNLLQMDIAVRDARADGPGQTGWVFGTFAYNGQVNNPNKFLNLVPIGVMWGNDPNDTTNTTNPFPPTETKVNPALKETVIFPSTQLPPQHLGWNGRLNGPADLNTTSCLSCHITAQYPAVTKLVPDGACPGRRTDTSKARGIARVDALVPESAGGDLVRRTDLLDGLLVPGGDQPAEFLRRERVAPAGRLGERLCAAAAGAHCPRGPGAVASANRLKAAHWREESVLPNRKAAIRPSSPRLWQNPARGRNKTNNPLRGGCHMRLFRSFARELARPVGACLVVFATWALLDRTVLTQAPAPAPPAGGTAAPPAPPAGGGRAGDPTPAPAGRGGGRAACFPRSRRKRSRSCVRRWIV